MLDPLVRGNDWRRYSPGEAEKITAAAWNSHLIVLLCGIIAQWLVSKLDSRQDGFLLLTPIISMFQKRVNP
jgi:hypothetical protein